MALSAFGDNWLSRCSKRRGGAGVALDTLRKRLSGGKGARLILPIPL